MNFFQIISSKKITRQQFLISLGVIGLSISGISGVLNRFKDPNLLVTKKYRSKKNNPKLTTFGSGPYGL